MAIRIKDLDLKIMMKMDDDTLFNFCSIKDKYCISLCENENFWKERFLLRFGEEFAQNKLEDIKWRKYYLFYDQILSLMY